MIKWHIGCSGFQYKHWKYAFYPDKLAQKNWFRYYAEFFDTVELNVTFYRFPDSKMVDRWYSKSPDDFIFTIKAPRIITHYKKLNDCESLLKQFYDIILNGIKEKLGCLLFQFPPMFSYTDDRLNKILALLDPAFKNVVEFRHASWWQQDVYQKLGKKNITFCGMSHPLLPQTIISNNQVLYYRLHGVPNLYQSPYSSEYLQNLKEEILKIKTVKSVYIYFNNDIDASAINNSKEMLALIGHAKKVELNLFNH